MNTHVAFVFMILIAVTPSRHSQEQRNDLSYGRCSDWLSYGPPLMQNLKEYYCIELMYHEDSCLAMPVGDTLDEMLRNKYPSSGKWRFSYIYSIREFDNIRLYWLHYPHDPDLTGVDVAYDVPHQRYYLLRDIDMESLNALIGTDESLPDLDAEIMQYCWFITFLKNAPNPVEPIASVKEAILKALDIMHIYSLDYLRSCEKLIAELPVIQKRGDLTDVTYYALVGLHMKKVMVVIKGRKVISYIEEDIGSVVPGY